MSSKNDLIEIVKLLARVTAPHEGNLNERRRTLLDGLARIVAAGRTFWVIGSFQKNSGSVSISSAQHQGDWEQPIPDHNAIERIMNSIHCSAMIETCGGKTQSSLRTLSETNNTSWPANTFSGVLDQKDGAILYFLHSSGEGNFSCLGIQREDNGSAFTDRERFLVQVVFRNLEWIHGTSSNSTATKSAGHLSYRQREVLMLLLRGRSRKAIAASLRLSEHTVVEYLSQIYRHFNARTKGELLASFISREYYERRDCQSAHSDQDQTEDDHSC